MTERAITSTIVLTPHGTLEGWQDGTNGITVSGWVWDQKTPDRPIAVDIFDGTRLLATISADAQWDCADRRQGG